MRTGSKRTWLLTTVVLLFLSMSAGFAMHQKQSHMQGALLSLKNAQMKLSKVSAREQGEHRARTLTLINQAIEALQMEAQQVDDVTDHRTKANATSAPSH